MVDEQLPLQRKILKGQVVVRNKGTGVYARSEMNNSGVHSGLLLTPRQISVSLPGQGQTMGCTKGLKWPKCQVKIKFISAVFCYKVSSLAK